MKLFVTGAAGFIGFHLCRRLLEDGHTVVGYDGMTPYYDPELKRQRAAALENYPRFSLVVGMLEDATALRDAYAAAAPTHVVHLAAQAGVRYGLENPDAYVSSNIIGTFNLIELLKEHPPEHFLFASTSSVYGANDDLPFSEEGSTTYPLSLYAATKRSGELLTHAYANLHRIPTTCFRFFTVYGPWGRPDMALYKFVERIEQGAPIEVYGGGDMARDFTYVDDLVETIVRLLAVTPTGPSIGEHDTLSPVAPWRVVNTGGGQPTSLRGFIESIERALGSVAVKTLLPMQPGDVRTTDADNRLLVDLIGEQSTTPLDDGIARFVEWYRNHRG